MDVILFSWQWCSPFDEKKKQLTEKCLNITNIEQAFECLLKNVCIFIDLGLRNDYEKCYEDGRGHPKVNLNIKHA